MIRHYIPHLLLMTIILFHPDLERFPTPQGPGREMAQNSMEWEHQRSEEGQSSPYSVGSISPNNAVEEHGQLRVEGNRLVNQEGRSLQLRGMSFFWSQWIGKYYTYETVKWLRDDWHCNAVRVAMAVEHEGYLANPEKEKQKIMEVIDAAIELGIYVIIDWHDHRAEDHLEESVAFFGEMAERYGSHPNIIYEPYNEPLNVPWKTTLKPYHEAVVAEIRKHDADNLIICGTPNWSQDVEDVIGARIDDPNVMYTLHYYAATHKQELRDKALLALEKGIPLFVTEYGLSQATGDGSIDGPQAQLWWEFLDEHGISHLNWSIADKEELSAALKPNASANGGWSVEDLTLSGSMVRDEIRKKNRTY